MRSRLLGAQILTSVLAATFFPLAWRTCRAGEAQPEEDAQEQADSVEEVTVVLDCFKDDPKFLIIAGEFEAACELLPDLLKSELLGLAEEAEEYKSVCETR